MKQNTYLSKILKKVTEMKKINVFLVLKIKHRGSHQDVVKQKTN